MRPILTKTEAKDARRYLKWRAQVRSEEQELLLDVILRAVLDLSGWWGDGPRNARATEIEYDGERYNVEEALAFLLSPEVAAFAHPVGLTEDMIRFSISVALRKRARGVAA